MAYNQEIYQAAMAELDQRRSGAEASALTFRQTMIARYPRLAQIEREIAATSSDIARAIMGGDDVAQTVETIKQRNLALQQEMADILRAAGAGRTSFDPLYTCPLCHDTGYVEGRMCTCLQALMREEACRRLSRMAAMELTSFDDMQLSYYPDETDPRLGQSPRARMRGVLSYCRDYAEHFSTASPNLLVSGPTGVGKTHAVLAIARAATERGFGVVLSLIHI